MLHKWNNFSLGNFNIIRRKSFTSIVYCDVSCNIFEHFKMLFPLFREAFARIFLRSKKGFQLPTEWGTPKNFFLSRLSEKKENVEKKMLHGK